jgi:class 3 adenylate cyclase/TolB-like protein
VTGKLTTIVAVDVDGFSALAEADEAAAIAAVARLGERCAKIAESYGGRIFNTSGDAVLMEFSSVSGGVHAAADLAADPDPPIRVGVHVGEASLLPTGDMLGRGVSVAAQLQKHARPGVVLVSEDAKDALRSALADRLVQKGAIKLEKPDETLAVFEFVATEKDRRRRPFTRTQLMLAGAATLAALVVLGLLALPLLRRAPHQHVAVLTLAAGDDGELRGLAEGIAEDATLALNARRINTLPRAAGGHERDDALARAQRDGAELALAGEVARDGRTLRVTMSVARTADRATLWTQTFEAPVEAGNALRRQAAAQGANALACGSRALSARHSNGLSADTLALLLAACSDADNRDRLAENRAALQGVAARAPDFPLAHAMLAAQTAALSATAAEPQRAQLRTEAREHAELALRRDRRAGEAYLALERLEPRRRWDARERMLKRGLEHDERNSALNAEYAALLFEVGRFTDALAHARNSSTLDPLSIAKRHAVGSILLESGDIEQARDIAHQLSSEWPDDPNAWFLQLRVAFWSGAYDDALALIAAPASQIRSTRARQCWRYAADIMRASAPQAAVERVIDCNESGDLPTGQTLMQLSALGRLDEAFALARARFVDEQRGGEDALFSAATQAMRRDARFIPLANDLGLVAYWRLSGNWPDFCREADLPYRCEDEARRLP